MAFYLTPYRMTRSGLVYSFGTPVPNGSVIVFGGAKEEGVAVVALAGREPNDVLALIPDEQSALDFAQSNPGTQFYTIPINALLTIDVGWTVDEIKDFLSLA